MWWVIAIVLALIVLAFLKYEHYRKTGHVILLLLILALVYFSMFAMIRTEKLDFSTPRSTITSFAVYARWLGESSFKLLDIGRETIDAVGDTIRINQTEEKKR